jgi:hypothetical protein
VCAGPIVGLAVRLAAGLIAGYIVKAARVIGRTEALRAVLVVLVA